MEWISVNDKLPKHREKVLIFCTNRIHGDCGTGIQTAVFWAGDFLKHGNNKTPYVWDADGGPMSWFGQDVSHWMPLPEPPKV